MRPPGSRRQVWRYGSILLFCGVPLLLAGAILLQIVGAWEAHEEADRQQAVLSKIIGQLARHHTRSLTASDTASLYLFSASASLARAELQDRLGKMVGQAGGRLVEIQAVGTPDSESEGQVAIHAALAIDNAGLRDLLYAVESGLPLLDVSDLSVTHDTARAGETPDATVGDTGSLEVEMTVRGHWRKTAG